MNSKLEIVYVVDIEIKGKKFINEEELESEIKKQNNYLKSQDEVEVVTKGDKGREKRQQDYDKDLLEEDAVMRVLFKLGDRNENDAVVEVEESEEQSDDSEAGDEILD